MVESTCTSGFTFSLISWLCINQSGHNIYQIEAGYLSYRMVTVMLLLVKEFKIYVLKRTKIDIFSHQFLNVDSSFSIKDRLLKFSVGIIDILMEGIVSHISNLGPSSSFMRLQI